MGSSLPFPIHYCFPIISKPVVIVNRMTYTFHQRCCKLEMKMFTTPPKMVYDDTGQLVEVILSAQEYLHFLHFLTKEADWETLPPHFQDAIDQLLIDEVRAEKETAVSLESILDK
jgi:hypothetical protein